MCLSKREFKEFDTPKVSKQVPFQEFFFNGKGKLKKTLSAPIIAALRPPVRAILLSPARLAMLLRFFFTFYRSLIPSGMFIVTFTVIIVGILLGGGSQLFAQNAPVSIPYFDFGIRSAESSEEVSLSLQILLLITVLTIAPSIIIMMTSFIRVAIILKFVQRALSLQQEPPNQVILGLALFISFFIMAPTFSQIYNNAYLPYSNQEISTTDFFEGSLAPLKTFMLNQAREKDLDLFISLAEKERPASPADVSMVELIPAFIISEITRAFQIGIYLFIPFIVIDMIVASILMSMGMILIPPIAISLPFKIILFVLVDGWHLITLQTVRSFQI